MILGGYPITADPQVMAWYPVSLLFYLFNSWNGYMVAAYVLASCFTYGYVHTLTASRLASAVSGLVYGLSGFMMAHLGHTTIIHCAAWLPLIIWSLEMLRSKRSAAWLATGSTALACSFLAGHPQIFYYTLLLAAAYIVVQGWNAPAGRVRYYITASVVITLGIGLSAIQLLPTIELSGLSMRSEMSYQNFISYALPSGHLPIVLFPYLFGGSGWYAPYFGRWNIAELTGYIGLLPLMLAAAALVAGQRRGLALFWFITALIALLLTLGGETPLARLTFHLPVINKFRVPARHFLEAAFAVSILSGLGVAAIQRGAVKIRSALGIVVVIGGALAGCLGALLFYRNYWLGLAISNGIEGLRLSPWANPATGVPLMVFLCGAAAFICFHRNPRSAWTNGVLLLVLTLDLATFGWFCYWQDQSPRKEEILTPPISAARYRPILEATAQRLMPLQGALGTRDEIFPDISRLWGVPSASGYGPLLLRRVGEMASMNNGGVVDQQSLAVDNQSLNLMAVRFITLRVPQSEAVAASGAGGPTRWAADDLDLSIGRGCGATDSPVLFNLPTPIAATKVGIVSWLGCSGSIPNAAEVARITIVDDKGKTQERQLVAGRDTSEFAYDCSDVRPHVLHDRAPVFSSFPINRESGPCEGHRYVATVSLDEATKIKSVEIKWVAGEGVLSIRKVSLIDEPASLSYSMRNGSLLPADDARWRHVEEIGLASVYENLKVMPRAWLVPEAVRLNAEEALDAIKSSKLPDGRRYDPTRMALVEEGRAAFKVEPFDAQASAQVTRLSPNEMEVKTVSSSPSFLVTSDVYYPGWVALLDGTQVDLVRTNYTLRGVAVPAGSHVVEFVFRPKLFYYGATLSAATALLLLLFCCFRAFNVRQLTDNVS
ncbi:MAG: YfhO family protein [Pyrinomonadaceae bacterium]